MKILVTYFDPFGGGTTNSSAEAAALLPETIENIEIIKAQLPTTYNGSVEQLTEMIALHIPDIIVMLGQAEGRIELSLERIGINLDEATLPDNAGELRSCQPAVPDAPDGYFVTLPIKEMAEAARQGGIPAGISNSAGSFACNHLLFCCLHLLKTKASGTLAGFIHIPATPAQAAVKRAASMDSRTAAEGLIHMFRAIEQHSNTGKKEALCQKQ